MQEQKSNEYYEIMRERLEQYNISFNVQEDCGYYKVINCLLNSCDTVGMNAQSDIEWFDNTTRYGSTYLNAKVASKKNTLEESIIFFLDIVSSLSSISSKSEAIKIALKSLTECFFIKFVLLPNNEQRCTMLKIAILSGNTERWVSYKEVSEFWEDDNCYFGGHFKCKKISRECSEKCGCDVTLETILNDLQRLNVIENDIISSKCRLV